MNSKYKKLKVYYFSGTGNAKHCAAWICETAEKNGISADMIDISKTAVRSITSPDSETLIGFCSPTHGFHFPEITRKFIRRFSTSKGSDAFILNTRAGVRIFKTVIPGLSGVLHYVSSLVLMIKGYKIVGLIPVDLPSNWISIHPAIAQTGTDIIYASQKIRVTNFAEKILSGKRVYRALYDIIQDLIISPVTLGYLLMGRFFFSKSYFASRECNQCMLCLKECPVKAISVVDGRMFWASKCESCMHCMNICPKQAIETPHGFLIGFFYMFSVSISAGIAFLITNYNAAGYFGWANNEFIKFIITSAVVLPFYFMTYRIIHYLMRFRFVERIMTLTSLTHLKYWGRYKASKKF
jgi:ferredoxin